MQSFTDQTGYTLQLRHRPQRIVSLVPSQTELLFDLGVGERVVGVTLFCIHPAEPLKTITRVGGTKKVNMRRLFALKPDLIIGNKEENSKEQIETLRKACPTWISDVHTLEDALAMIRSVGGLTGATAHEEMVAEIGRRFARMRAPEHPLRTAYLIWQDPVMVAGSQTFIDAMMHHAGLQNIFGHLTRYPEITMEALAAAQPEVVILSSEPFSFDEAHRPVFQEACPMARVILADATYFSWYGSRLLRAPAYFDHLLTYLEMP